MGTRHLTVVVKDKKYKVAQYGQWDGYLEGQGETVVKFLLGTNLNYFKEQIDKVKFISDAQLKKYWVACGANPDSDMVSMAVSDRFKNDYPTLSRDTGADVLYEILKGGTELRNNIEFAGSSLFCEWVYLIDLDAEVLEVYQGFNKKKLSKKDRFYKLKSDTEGYEPVKLLKKYKFSDLTKNTMKELSKSLETEGG